MKRLGFTLMEMLVAMAIFAMIAMMSTQFLTQTINTSELLLHRGDRVEEIHRTMSILSRDIQQIVMRGIRDEAGEFMDPLTLDNAKVLELTRSGWSNFFNRSRSTFQRVQYSAEGDTLIRRFWTVLDRDFDSAAREQVLLTNVHDIEFSMIDSSGEEVITFPELLVDDPSAPPPEQIDPEAAPAEVLPIAIKVRMLIPPIGDIERVWVIPVLPTIEVIDESEEEEGANPLSGLQVMNEGLFIE